MAVKKSYAVRILACLVAVVVLLMSPVDVMAASVSDGDYGVMTLSLDSDALSNEFWFGSSLGDTLGHAVNVTGGHSFYLSDEAGIYTCQLRFYNGSDGFDPGIYHISLVLSSLLSGVDAVAIGYVQGFAYSYGVGNYCAQDGDIARGSEGNSYLLDATINLTSSAEYLYLAFDFKYFPTILSGEIVSVTLSEGSDSGEDSSKNIFELLRDFFGSFFEKIVASVKNAIESTFDALGEKIKSWFIPTPEELTAFLDEVNAWFSERLGFIWYPFSLALDLVSALAGGSSDQQFVVPALHLNILGESYAIWNEITVDLDAFGIFKYVRLFTSFLLVSAVIKLAIDKWDEWIGGHGTG